MADCDLSSLHRRMNDAGTIYDTYRTRVRSTANGARSEVVSSLEIAMQALIGVVTKVHASYTEDEELDASGQKLLNDMRASFEQVEKKAEARYQDFAKIHEEIASFESGTIVPLQIDLQNAIDEANRHRNEAQSKSVQARIDYDNAVRKRDEIQLQLNQFEAIETNSVLNAAAKFWDSAFGSLVAKAVAPEETAKLRETIASCKNILQDQRTSIASSQRIMSEAEEVNTRNYETMARSSSILEHLTPLADAAQGLADNSSKFKELLIRIKGSAVNLVKEATEVAGSTEVASENSNTKSDFAQGILNICQEALFDVIVQDEVETVLKELVGVWAVDGKLAMPKHVQKRYQEVHSLVQEFKQDSKMAEWDKMIAELNASR